MLNWRVLFKIKIIEIKYDFIFLFQYPSDIGHEYHSNMLNEKPGQLRFFLVNLRDWALYNYYQKKFEFLGWFLNSLSALHLSVSESYGKITNIIYIVWWWPWTGFETNPAAAATVDINYNNNITIPYSDNYITRQVFIYVSDFWDEAAVGAINVYRCYITPYIGGYQGVLLLKSSSSPFLL